MQIAIGRLESSVAEDWDKAEAELKLAMRDPVLRDLATCSMALLHVKRGNQEAVANFIRKSHELFPEPSLDKKSFLLRIRLSCETAAVCQYVGERQVVIATRCVSEGLKTNQTQYDCLASIHFIRFRILMCINNER